MLVGVVFVSVVVIVAAVAHTSSKALDTDVFTSNYYTVACPVAGKLCVVCPVVRN